MLGILVLMWAKLVGEMGSILQSRGYGQHHLSSAGTPTQLPAGPGQAQAGPWGKFLRAHNRDCHLYSHPPHAASPSPPPPFPPVFPVFPSIWQDTFLWHGTYRPLYIHPQDGIYCSDRLCNSIGKGLGNRFGMGMKSYGIVCRKQ